MRSCKKDTANGKSFVIARQRRSVAVAIRSFNSDLDLSRLYAALHAKVFQQSFAKVYNRARQGRNLRTHRSRYRRFDYRRITYALKERIATPVCGLVRNDRIFRILRSFPQLLTTNF